MKRRIVVFGWIWAFALNAFWVPGGLDSGYFVSLFFPAWYLFLLGLVVGGLHEWLATHRPRIWISLGISAVLTEICFALFHSKFVGLFLAIPMVLATVLASCAAAQHRLTRLPVVPFFGCLLVFLSGLTLLYTIGDNWLRRGERTPVPVSPSTAFKAYIRLESVLAVRPPTIYIGPRYAPETWFSARVAEGYTPLWMNNQRLSFSTDQYTKVLNQGRYLLVAVSPRPTK